jgi:formiminotetrahydrofolate cyclodeaminase
MVQPFLGQVMLEHAVMTLQQMGDVVAEIPPRPHRGLLGRPANGRRAHNLEDPALRLGDFEAPIPQVVVCAERAVRGLAHPLQFAGNIHHLQPMFVIVGRHGESVSPSAPELTRFLAGSQPLWAPPAWHTGYDTIPNTVEDVSRRDGNITGTMAGTMAGTTANGIWGSTLESFRRSVANAEPAPAGVSVSAVTATLGVSLLQMVLEIVAKRKSFAGDPEELSSLRQAAKNESERLARCADEDIAAYRAYVAARRLKTGDAETARCLRAVIEAPLQAARSALSGLDLCAAAAGMVDGAVAADLGTAAILLAGAVRALLLSVDVNLRQLPDREAMAEYREIEAQALRQLDSVLRRVTIAAGLT